MDKNKLDVVEIKSNTKGKTYWSYLKYEDKDVIEILQPKQGEDYVNFGLGEKLVLSINRNKKRIMLTVIVMDIKISETPPYIVAKIINPPEIVNENRNYLRVNAVIKLNIWESEDSINKLGDMFNGITENISCGGASIIMDEKKINTDNLIIEFDYDNKNVSIGSKILNIKQLSDNKMIVYVNFINISDYSEAVITIITYDYQRLYGSVDL
jgi:hypothetical protein